MKKIISTFLILTLVVTALGASFAQVPQNDSIEISDLGIVINGRFYNNIEVVELLKDIEYVGTVNSSTNLPQARAAIALIPAWAIGKWVIPLIGTVVITPTVIELGGVVVDATSKLFSNIITAVGNILFSQSPEEESNERIDDAIQGKEKIKDSSSDIYETEGGYNQAEEEFERLIEGPVKTYANGTKVGELPDGTKVNLRRYSSDGRATIEIQRNRYIKIRYN